MTVIRKACGPIALKADADEGSVVAKIATFGVIDRDGDVLAPGSVKAGPVMMSAFQHTSWKGAPPIGTGETYIDGDALMFKGRFLTETTHGKDAWLTVKALADQELGEWSFSLKNVVSESTTVDGRKANLLKAFDIHEVSPVIVGASIDTKTVSVKADAVEPAKKQLQSSLARLLSAAGRDRWQTRYSTWVWLEDFDVDDGFVVYGIEEGGATYTTRLVQVSFERTDTSVTLGDEETEVHETAVYLPKRDREGARMKFSEHLASVLADVKALTTRASDVVALRAEKGKGMSPANVDLLKQVAAAVDDLVDTVDTPDTTPTPPPRGDETTPVVDEDQAAIAAELNALELDVIASDLEGDEA
jgi:hypothetical protein